MTGGVGKTTLVFHLATQYAHKNPDKRVVVLDMCPQANVTGALLKCASDMANQEEIKADLKKVIDILKIQSEASKNFRAEIFGI